MRKALAVVLSSSLLYCQAASAALPDIPRLNSPVTVDGELTEEVWQNAATLELETVTWPHENTQAPVKTIVRYFDNGDTLFVAFNALDPNPENIRAYYNDRDDIWRDDLIGIKLDPYNDHRLVFQFFVNPLGVQADSTENVVGSFEESSWDGIWDSAGKVTDTGYQVEVAIPLRNFNFNPRPGKQTWAVEFLRFYPRSDRLRISNMAIDRNNDCWACQMRPIEGLENIQQGKDLAIVPTLVIGQAESRDLPDEFNWEQEQIIEPGLDIKWGISSDIFLNATFNPDFSQVEADAGQLGINNNFTLFFPERRPFFLENQDTFSSDFNLIYTRNIGAPDIGAKLTGKVDKHTFGIFATNDESTTFLVPGNLSSSVAVLEQESKNTALRYRYDANSKLSFGMLGTLRTSDDYHNYVGSIDVNYRLTDQDEFKIQLIKSDTEYPDWLANDFCNEDECDETPDNCAINDCAFNEQVLRLNNQQAISDSAFRFKYSHEERNWFANVHYYELGKDFRADLGFESQVDISRAIIGGGYLIYGDQDDWYNRWRINGDWDIMHDSNGDVIEREVEAHVSVTGPLQSYLEFACIDNEHVGNRFDDRTLRIRGNTDKFDHNFCFLYGDFQPVSGLFLQNEILQGKQIDFRNNRLADWFLLRPGFEYSFNEHLQAELKYRYEKLEADGQEVFTANLADLRLKYNFDTRNSLKLSLIYTDIHQNLNNQPLVATEDLPSETFIDVAMQLIYSYRINPQTVFFAGYSDHAYEDQDVTQLEKDNRAVFMKFSYAWLL